MIVHIQIGSYEKMTDTSETVEYWNQITRSVI